MSKKLLWTDLKDLRGLVATQNVTLLTAIVEVIKSNQAHFDKVVEDKNYVLGTLDTLNKNTADIKEASDKVNKLVNNIIPGTKRDVVRTRDNLKFLSLLSDLQKCGEIVALTGSDIIIELTTRLKVANTELITDVVITTEKYLGESEDGNK